MSVDKVPPEENQPESKQPRQSILDRVRVGGNLTVGNITQTFVDSGKQQLSRQEFRNRRALLAQVKNEVHSRLEQSLHKAMLINLQKEKQPQQVKCPWDVEVKVGKQPSVLLSQDTKIIDVFEQEAIARRLLILGAPGAGKTTTMLELARDLIARAEKKVEEPIPVLFNLSSWKDDKQSIAQWMVTELKDKYGVRQTIGRQWIQEHELLPLLDGLDELESMRQEKCVQAINLFLESEERSLYLVVCSRSEEYGNYDTMLQLNGAIYLQPLTDNQICNYLVSLQRSDLFLTISCDLKLLELVRSPLVLSITTLTCADISTEEWHRRFNSTRDRLQYLLHAYVRQMLMRGFKSKVYESHKRPTSRQTQQWLVWFDQQLQKESQTEFLIENIQPTWLLTNSQKRRYSLQYFLSLFLIWAIIWAAILLLITKLMTSNGINLSPLTLLILYNPQRAMWFIVSILGFYLGITVSSIWWAISEFRLDINIKTEINSLFKTILSIPNIWNFKINFNDNRILCEAQKYLSFYIRFLAAINIFIKALQIVNKILYETIIEQFCVNVRLVETLSWSWKNTKTILVFGASLSFIIALLLLPSNLNNALISASIFFLSFVVSCGIISVSPGSVIEIRTVPNQGIWDSMKNAVNCGLINATIGGLITGISYWLFYQLSGALVQGLLGGLVFGLLGALSNGGNACLQHLTLRLILQRNGCMPLNYARFLNYATELMFLQRVGGRYRFIHKLLQDHFAEMDPNQE
jgi:DNA polymerase III delta prime subunit